MVFLLLLLLLSPLVVVANRPVITLGRSYEGSGVYQVEGAGTKNGIDFWAEFVNNSTGLIINGTSYTIAFKQYSDASDVDTTGLIYSALSTMGLPLLIGPWTTQLTGPALKAMNGTGTNTPILFPGASSPAFYGVYPFAFGTLVTSGKRSLPCIQYFSTQGAKTAAIIASTDAFQQVTYPLLISQLVAYNITLLYNVTVDLSGTEDMNPYVNNITKLRPDLILCAMESPSFIPFIQTLRLQAWSPKAILVTNAATAIKAYNSSGWAFDGIFAGDQWSPFFQYVDPWFGSNANFVNTYISRFNYTPTFVDAAAVIGGFIVGDALSRAASLSSSDVIAAIASTYFNQTFYGPITFKANGELTAPTICEQVLPPAGISRTATSKRNIFIVFPISLSNQNATYPVIPLPPPSPALSPSETVAIGVGVGVGGFLLIVAIVTLVLFLVNRKFHLLFIPRQMDNDEWGSAEQSSQ